MRVKHARPMHQSFKTMILWLILRNSRAAIRFGVPTEYLLLNGCHHTNLRNLLPEVALHSYLILDCWKFDDWCYDWTQPRGSWPHLMRPLGLSAIGGSGTTHTPVVIATIFGTSFGRFRYLGPTPHSASWF